MMNIEAIKKQVMAANKGSFHAIAWERPMKVKKAYAGNTIVKRSAGVVRFGVEYDNMKAVQAKRESGELPVQNQGLKWGEWAVYPYFISHKGNTYLRCSTASNRIQSTYTMNGKPVTLEEIKPMLLASELNHDNVVDVFTVNCENILDIR